ncbi:hypothetical protein RJ527_08155 [Thalassospiraceae bacterium LMO-SO8]|nr:hypothetical protein [Alphaproteobacteria bacterium LMO-S08]WND77706.1 hypothetical protein RJ527_08155 [Thalassospiraceae bacterium LMO-SO8]
MAASLCLIALARIFHAQSLMTLRRCGDEYGYIFYRFDDLRSALSGIRAPGFPLVVELYEAVFPHFGYWPTFQVTLWSLSVIWLYFSLTNYGLRPLYGFVLCAPMFLSGPAIMAAPYLCSDGTAATLAVATTAALFTARRRGDPFSITVMGLLALMVVLTRPSFLPILPCLAVAWMVMRPASLDKRGIAAVCIALTLPLGLFIGARYMLTGHIGLSGMGQLLLSGHATAYLKNDHLPGFDPEVRAIAKTILDRRARLQEPCNLAADENIKSRPADDWMESVRLEHFCYGPWYHTATLAAYEFGTGLLPRADTGGIYEPWPSSGSSVRHPPPPTAMIGDPAPWSWGGDRWLHDKIFSPETGRSAVFFDRILGRYNNAVLAHERGLYVRWLAGESVIAAEETMSYLLNNRSFRWGAGLLTLLLVTGVVVLVASPSRMPIYRRALFGPLNDGERVIVILGIGLPAAVVGLTLAIVYIYDRYLDAPAVFLPGVVWLINLRLVDALVSAVHPQARPSRHEDSAIL